MSSDFQAYELYVRCLFYEDEDHIFFQLVHSTKTHKDERGNDVKDTKLSPLLSMTELVTEKFYRDILLKYEEEGWQIYVCMNPFPIGTVRRMEMYVDIIRNLYIESDGEKDTLALIQADVAAGILPRPHSILESSPGKYHIVWHVEDFTPETAKPRLRALAARYGGDPQATDLHRVLRMPGFHNLKYPNKPATKLIEDNLDAENYIPSDFKLSVDAPRLKSSATTPENLTNIISRFVENAEKAKFSLGAESEHAGGVKWVIECPWAKEHTTAGNTAAVFVMADGSLQFNCFHAHCAKRGWSDIKKLWESVAGPLKFGDALQLNNASTQTLSTAIPATIEWGTPEPISGELSEVLPFSSDFLPRSIQPWVIDVAERMSVPLDFAGICALVTLAGVIGRRVFVFPKANDKEWKESICLPGAVVAQSGRTKTPCWKTFVNVVVENEFDWREEHKTIMAKYEADLAAREDSDQKEPEPIKPAPCRCNLLNDATPEAMHATMENNPEGVLYFRDELSSWVAEFDKKEREVQRGMFLAAMNGNDPYAIDRIGRGRIFAIMCASVFGGFQPELLKAFLNDSRNISDGMIPRFPLLVWPDDIDFPLIDRPANEPAKQTFRRIVRTLAAMKAESVSLHFHPDAQKRFNDFLTVLTRTVSKERNLGKQSHLNKYKGALPKIAGLFQIVDLIDLTGASGILSVNIDNGNKTTGPVYTGLSGSHFIDLEHLEKALRFIGYLESHMHRIYDCIADPIHRAELALVEHIKKGDLKDGFSLRYISRKHWTDLLDSENVDLALEDLEEKQWLRRFISPAGPQGGRPSARWQVNPNIA